MRKMPLNSFRKGRVADNDPRVAVEEHQLQLRQRRLEAVVRRAEIHVPDGFLQVHVFLAHPERNRRQHRALQKPDTSRAEVLRELPAGHQKFCPLTAFTNRFRTVFPYHML